MKRISLALLALLLLLTGCATPGHAAPAESQPEPEGLPNAVDLYFPSNPTTGYEWSYEIESPGIVELDEDFLEPDTPPGLVGAGGTQWYRIRGLSEGVTSVTFRYARSWEDSALNTFVYRLQVDGRGSVLIWGVEMS